MTEEARRAQFEELLCEETYQAAWRFCCRLCTAAGRVQVADAEDLLQESLGHAYAHLQQLRDTASFKGWLLSIVRSRCFSRRRRQHPATVQLDDAPPLAVPAAEDPLGAEVLEALSQLPAAQQELLRLFYCDSLSLAETGQVLGLAPRAVRQRLHRAREALRRRLVPRAAPATVTVSPGSSEGVVQ